MNAVTEIPPEMADVIVAIIIYFAAASMLLEKGIAAVKAKLRSVS